MSNSNVSKVKLQSLSDATYARVTSKQHENMLVPYHNQTFLFHSAQGIKEALVLLWYSICTTVNAPLGIGQL